MDDLNTFKLEQVLGFYINRSAYLMTEEIESRFVQAGMPIVAQDFAILVRLMNEGVATQAKITQLMMRDKTTITRRLDGLTKKGLVERVENPKDRRCFNIQLTDKGREVLEEAFPMARAFQQEVVKGVSEEDKIIAVKTLKIIIDTLMAMRDQEK